MMECYEEAFLTAQPLIRALDEGDTDSREGDPHEQQEGLKELLRAQWRQQDYRVHLWGESSPI